MVNTTYALFIIVSLTCCSARSSAQDSPKDWTRVKSFVVVKMEKKHGRALFAAREASRRLHLALDLRGLSYNKEAGLSISKAESDSNGWVYPAYYARGRFDDGNYVSIEWSNVFDSLTRGYYVVVVGSGENDSPWLLNTLHGSRKVYPEAFITRTNVYLGCMH